MKDTSLVYNNSLFSPEDFINSVLYTEPKEQLPTCDIEESPDFYYININSFYDDKHILEISYKNNFLILKFVLNNDFRNLLFERIFYLLKIDLNNILLHEHRNSINLIIPKAT
ncbi:hypothetical protein [Clostridium sp.]|uniref:hypothetical protein n=1 Tax=Clostridium sp. TaxID=1506 RepID=UPI00260BC33C|nr:hypothetical protein [Clostridium sp.]